MLPIGSLLALVGSPEARRWQGRVNGAGSALRIARVVRPLVALVLLLTVELAHGRYAGLPRERSEAREETGVGALEFDAMLFDEQQERLVLVNGYQPPVTPEHVQLWSWSGSRWEEIPAAGPAMRTVTDAVYDSRRGRIVLFGGLGVAGLADPRADTWEWDGKRWSQGSDASVGARDHHDMAYDEVRGRTVLFGGTTSEGDSGARAFSRGTFEWDGSAWTKRADTGPGARGAVGLTYDAERERVLLFGGVGDSPARLGDTWTWDGEVWKQVSEEGPPPRNGHAMAFDARARVVLLFGGTNGSRHFDDLWKWDGRRWTEIPVTGPRPSARVGAALAHDKARGRTVLYGGHVKESGRVEASDEMWEWDGERWTQIQ